MKNLLLVLLSIVSLGARGAPDPSWAIDVAGGRDHPLIHRYQNSWLLAYQQLPFEATSFPGQLGFDRQLRFLSPVAVEGKVTRLVYFAPSGKTRLEVQRNYEQALAGAGFKAVFRCTPRDRGCDSEHNGLEERYATMKQADFAASRNRQPAGSVLGEQMRGLGGPNMLGSEDAYLTYGTLPGSAGPVHVMLHTAKVYQTDFTATYLEIAEPQAMLGGQVTVDAEALKKGLQSDGKIALYGIYFDTGKALLKSESKAQLDEIARLLRQQPALRVYLVGHTDNAGSLDANLALSQQRAQAVADALVRQYQIDGKRLLARGVANLAPVASNQAEEGRARNRRVELVVQ